MTAGGSAPIDGERRPALIGLTTYLEQSQTGVWDVPASFLPKAYLDGVTEAGAVAVLLPPQPADAAVARTVVAGLDGLVLTGGRDVDPQRYGQVRLPSTDPPRLDRDAWESALLEAALAIDLPLLGICRGLQLINVCLGGTLHQHLPDVIGGSHYSGEGASFAANVVRVEPGSRLSSVLADVEAFSVMSHHHQAVDVVADGLQVSARGADGVIQALDLPQLSYGLAVQWHPEETNTDRRLFRSLVQAADSRSAQRRAGAVSAAGDRSAGHEAGSMVSTLGTGER